MFNYDLIVIIVTIIYSVLGIWHYSSIIASKLIRSVTPPNGFRNEKQFLEFLMNLKSGVIAELYRVKNEYLSEHLRYFAIYTIVKYLSPIFAVGIYFGLERYAGEISKYFGFFLSSRYALCCSRPFFKDRGSLVLLEWNASCIIQKNSP